MCSARVARLVWWGGALALALVLRAPAQQPTVPQEHLLLARIRHHMTESLKRLPNYTCQMTIQRHRADPKRKAMLPSDTIRLEVALVDGKELFAWPGSRQFEDRPITDLVEAGGAIGNGDFAHFAHAVFVGNSARFRHIGGELRNGRAAVRYDYEVPVNLAGYRITVDRKTGMVGYHGSFWADPETLDVLRLEVHADNIPPHIPLSAAGTAVEYQRARIGAADFLLPATAELTMAGFDGGGNRNVTRFTGCRQYTGESRLSFDEVDESSPATPAETKALDLTLPGNLTVESVLRAPAGEPPAVGDMITAEVRRDVKQKGRVLLPKGSLLQGRITRLEQVNAKGWTFVALRFGNVEAGGAEAEFHARLEELQADFVQGQTLFGPNLLPLGASARFRGAPARPGGLRLPPGIAVFYMTSGAQRLPDGLRLVWRTNDKEPQ